MRWYAHSLAKTVHGNDMDGLPWNYYDTPCQCHDDSCGNAMATHGDSWRHALSHKATDLSRGMGHEGACQHHGVPW